MVGFIEPLIIFTIASVIAAGIYLADVRPALKGIGKGGNQGPTPTLQLPKPPTHDQWWDTHGPERIGWVIAHFVESSGLFEIAYDLLRSPCKLCLGEGIKTFSTQTGEVVPYLCNRCAGGRYDLTVRYR